VSQDSSQLLKDCYFPEPGTPVRLAVSGGPDSLGLLLLAIEAGLSPTVHHVDHHARPTSTSDAKHLKEICAQLNVPFILHNVVVEGGGNFEARARELRFGVLPSDAMTGHTMEDLAETVLLNMLRGAGIDGMSPMIDNPTKPLRDVRRSDLHAFVATSSFQPVIDETNNDMAFRRNQVRQQLLPFMDEIAGRDITPLIARQAKIMFEERTWLDALSLDDRATSLEEADCRELQKWPKARLRRWLRVQLREIGEGGLWHPPTADEIERAMAVVNGEATAMELSGGRRLSRKDQRLTLT